RAPPPSPAARGSVRPGRGTPERTPRARRPPRPRRRRRSRRQDYRRLRRGAAPRAQLVTAAGGAFGGEVRGRRDHLLLDPPHDGVGPPGEEIAELVDDHPVLVRCDTADTRRGALVDVAEETRPPELGLPLVDARGARPDGEDALQRVESVPD